METAAVALNLYAAVTTLTDNFLPNKWTLNVSTIISCYIFSVSGNKVKRHAIRRASVFDAFRP
jgi:hypothetical protein